jgi:NitT/TauT family transport system substrate-binding protein
MDIDGGAAVMLIGGVMVGCVELFACEGIRSITELTGKRVGVQAIGSLPNIFIDLMAAEVGLRPEKDIDWVPPEGQAEGAVHRRQDRRRPQLATGIAGLRGRGIGHVIVKTSVDRPGRRITAVCWAVKRIESGVWLAGSTSPPPPAGHRATPSDSSPADGWR